MDTIKVFAYDSPEYDKLYRMSVILTMVSKKNTLYLADNTYFDYGQNWKWTTLIAHRHDGGSYQISPLFQEMIIRSDDLLTTAHDIVNHEYWKEL